jgi:hypothetical protein
MIGIRRRCRRLRRTLQAPERPEEKTGTHTFLPLQAALMGDPFMGINPAEYLQALFERLPKAKTSEIKSLTPAAWLKAKQAAVRVSA